MPVYRYDEHERIIKSQRPTGRWKWKYNFQIKKRRYKGVCHGCQTKQQAKDYEAEMKRAVKDGTYGKPDGTTTFEEYARGPYLRWAKLDKRTWRWDELQIDVFCAYGLGKKPLTEIERADIKDYMLRRREEITERGTQRSKVSVNRERALLCKIFNHAIEDGHLERGKNPCDGTRIKKAKGQSRRELSYEQERKLLNVMTGADAWLRPIVIVALGTAMRRGELLKMRIEHLDFDGDLIRLPPEITKSEEERIIPINANVRAALLEQCGARTQGAVFKVKPTRVSQRFNTICDRLGMGEIVFHCLRHTAITRMTESGISPFTIQAVAGHASLSQTADYTHVSVAKRRQAVKTLETGEESSTDVLTEKIDSSGAVNNSMPDGNLQAQV